MDKAKLILAALVVLGSIALYYYLSDLEQIFRVLIVVGGVVVSLVLTALTEPGQSAWAFAKGANVERQKVVWPTRREALQVTLFVIILVILIGLYLWLLDWISFQVIYDWILSVTN